jgi:plastocyanin
MNILRNAVITSVALVLGGGAVAHASGNSHSDDTRAGYYGQTNTSRHSDDNRAGYYGQVATKSAPVVAVAPSKALHKQVLAKEVKSIYLFGPKTVKIKVGTTITWSNTSDAEHNVTFDKNSKVNMDFKPNKSVSYTFTKAGTFTYHCEYHPFMKGTIVVHP